MLVKLDLNDDELQVLKESVILMYNINSNCVMETINNSNGYSLLEKSDTINRLKSSSDLLIKVNDLFDEHIVSDH